MLVALLFYVFTFLFFTRIIFYLRYLITGLASCNQVAVCQPLLKSYVIYLIWSVITLTLKVDEEQSADGGVIVDVMQREEAVSIVIRTLERYRRRRPNAQHCKYKQLCYRRRTARRAVSAKILSTAAQL